MGGNVVVIASDSDWKVKLDAAAAEGKTVVVDFTASWCGPCRMIAPFFEQLSEKYPSLVFMKVDIDTCQGVAAECGIQAMPTFQARRCQTSLQDQCPPWDLVWKDGKKVKEQVGASKDSLEAMAKEFA